MWGMQEFEVSNRMLFKITVEVNSNRAGYDNPNQRVEGYASQDFFRTS